MNAFTRQLILILLGVLCTGCPAAHAAKANSITVYITGLVNKPGAYSIPRGSGASVAIAAAGGLKPTANPTGIHILRHQPTAKSPTNYDIIIFNQFFFDSTGKGNIRLQNRDIINVPASKKPATTESSDNKDKSYTVQDEAKGLAPRSYESGNFIME